jgi:hypothetical protein
MIVPKSNVRLWPIREAWEADFSVRLRESCHSDQEIMRQFTTQRRLPDLKIWSYFVLEARHCMALSPLNLLGWFAPVSNLVPIMESISSQEPSPKKNPEGFQPVILKSVPLAMFEFQIWIFVVKMFC